MVIKPALGRFFYVSLVISLLVIDSYTLRPIINLCSPTKNMTHITKYTYRKVHYNYSNF